MHFGDRNIHINNVTEELNHCEIVSRWLMVANGGPTIFLQQQSSQLRFVREVCQR